MYIKFLFKDGNVLDHGVCICVCLYVCVFVQAHTHTYIFGPKVSR